MANALAPRVFTPSAILTFSASIPAKASEAIVFVSAGVTNSGLFITGTVDMLTARTAIRALSPDPMSLTRKSAPLSACVLREKWYPGPLSSSDSRMFPFSVLIRSITGSAPACALKEYSWLYSEFVSRIKCSHSPGSMLT